MKPERSRRLSKKLHKKYLYDVRYYVSLSEVWRQKLFESRDGDVYRIKRIANPDLQKAIEKYKLVFCVRRESVSGTKWIKFVFFPKEFPWMRKESLNPIP